MTTVVVYMMSLIVEMKMTIKGLRNNSDDVNTFNLQILSPISLTPDCIHSPNVFLNLKLILFSITLILTVT